MRFLSIILLSVLTSCINDSSDIRTVYTKRADIIRWFNDISIFRNRDQSIFLYTHQYDLKNEYIFLRFGDSYTLQRENILYSPDKILGTNEHSVESSRREQKLISELHLRIKKLDSLKIRSVSREFDKQGIDLKIYMESGEILVYVSDVKRVINSEWLGYLKRMTLIGPNWYYIKEDI
jgi:hypothetical protein